MLVTEGVLQANRVVTGYGKQEIVHGVSMTVARGEAVCVFGPNGSGKSTLIKAIVGLLSKWEGEIIVEGEDVTRASVHDVIRHKVAFMPQGGGIFPQLSVIENLRIGGYILTDRKRLDARVSALFERFPMLADKRKLAGGDLSGGEQMTLAIARVLVTEPHFVLLDEPSAGVAPALVKNILRQIEQLKALGVGILMIEQNTRLAMPIADRVCILAGGNEQFVGTPDQLQDDDRLMALYMGVRQTS